MNELALFAGNGLLPPFPIWSGVCSFDGRPWRGLVDVVSGGFPCQDIAVCGLGAGIEGARSGLWKHMGRIIDEVRLAWLENSPMLISRGLAVVLGDLAQMGYDAQWCCLSAAECGAPHRRNRIWIMANARGKYVEGFLAGITDSQIWTGPIAGQTGPRGHGAAWWATKPGMGRVADGVAYRVDRLKALGNAGSGSGASSLWIAPQDGTAIDAQGKPIGVCANKPATGFNLPNAFTDQINMGHRELKARSGAVGRNIKTDDSMTEPEEKADRFRVMGELGVSELDTVGIARRIDG